MFIITTLLLIEWKICFNNRMDFNFPVNLEKWLLRPGGLKVYLEIESFMLSNFKTYNFIICRSLHVRNIWKFVTNGYLHKFQISNVF